MRITKPIEVTDIIENLYKLDKQLEVLPKIVGDKVAFKVVINSIGDIIALADQYRVNCFEPSPSLPYHWCIIDIGDNVVLTLETSRELYTVSY